MKSILYRYKVIMNKESIEHNKEESIGKNNSLSG